MAQRGRNAALPAGYRWDVAARVFLAFVGGFACISTLGALCATLFAKAGWMPLAQGVYVMTLAGFIAWCGVAMLVFYQKRLMAVAAGLIGSTVIFYGLFVVVR